MAITPDTFAAWLAYDLGENQSTELCLRPDGSGALYNERTLMRVATFADLAEFADFFPR